MNRFSERRTVLLGAIALALPLVVACGTGGQPTASAIEEAKQVTAEFTATPWAPPPRTVGDVAAILDQQQLADPEGVARARARADQQPPATGDADVLARFYYQRGLAAGQLGRARQEIDDLTEAARWTARGAGRAEHEILLWLGIAEITGGNFSRGIDDARRATTKVPGTQKGWLVALNGIIASAHARAGDLAAAEAALEQSLRAYDESKNWWIFYPADALAAMSTSLLEAQAALAMARGRFAEAETLYRRAVAALQDNAVMSRHPWLDYLTGRVAESLIRQGRVLEAENEARAALRGVVSKRGRDAAPTGNLLTILAHVLAEQGRFDDVEMLARRAIDVYQRAGTPPDSLLRAVAGTWLGAALVAQGRWHEALAEYEAIRGGMAGDPESYGRFLAGDFGWALALLHTGRADRAIEILEVARARSEGLGEKYATTAQVRGFLAMAYAAQGERPRALREFAAAVPDLLTRALEVDEEAMSRPMRDRLLELILTAYIGLLADLRGTPLEQEVGIDAVAEAFRLADAARARSVQRALDASAARAAAATPALAALVREEQDGRRELSALYRLLARALGKPTDRQDPAVVRALQAQAASLRLTRERLAEQIAREFPAFAELVNPAPVTVGRARAALRPGEALIATYVGPERTYVWAIPRIGPVAFVAAPLGEQALTADVARLRRALDPRVATLGEIPEFDVALAHRLYSALLEPVQRAWRHAEALLVVPDRALGQVPFALLVTRPGRLGPERGELFANYRDVPWLVRTHALTVLPSVGALVTLRSLPSGDPTRRPFVGFGDPYFSREHARQARERVPAAAATTSLRSAPLVLRDLRIQPLDSARLGMLPRLPETADEIRSIAAALGADPARDLFLGAQANERTVKTLDLARYRVLAFATHGLVPGDLDGLAQPALALTAPEVAQVDGDGLLTMEEILGLRLNADWVVLSACNTASGRGAGAEAVSGLGRAFFYAGARALLVSHWPVETTSARFLTTDLFQTQRNNPGLGRARALQQTMNALLDEGRFRDPTTGQAVYSYAHPIFWAPFTLVGDGGGGGGAAP